MPVELKPIMPADATLTIREKAIQYLLQTIANMKQYDEGAVEIGPLFQNVRRGDPDDHNLQVVNAPFCFVEDGDEVRVQDNVTQGVVAKELIVYLHIRFAKGQQGVDPYTVFNYYLGRLQTLILADYKLGNNVLDVNETASSPQIFNEDRLQGGFLSLTVRYRHVRDNPYVQR